MKFREFLMLWMGLTLAFNLPRVQAEFQTVHIVSDNNYTRARIVVCQNSSSCDDIATQTFASSTQMAGQFIVTNWSSKTYLDRGYYFTGYVQDDVLEENVTLSYADRSPVVQGNFTATDGYGFGQEGHLLHLVGNALYFQNTTDDVYLGG